ncbi:MAG: rane-bound acyltransferase, partial [Thermoleophilia bacterium]|nr:rane-bound acyltransferase [Thermoleophilia bacterium]
AGPPPMHAMTGRPAPRRFAGLEGLRAVAALSVLAMHVWQFTGTTSGLRFSRVRPMAVTDTWLDRLLMQGILGVQLFFVLSGLLLFYPFARAIVERAPLPSVSVYFGRRVRRLFPLYWTVLAAFMVVTSVGAVVRYNLVELVVNGLLLQAYAGDMPNIMPLAWTLPIEIGFYAAVPLVALLVSRALARVARRSQRIAGALGAVTLLGLASILIRWFGVDHLAGVLVARTVVSNFDSFATGMLLAVAIAASGRPRRAVTTRSLGLAGVAVVALGAYLRHSSFVDADADLVRLLWPTVVAIGCALSVATVISVRRGRRALTHLLDTRVMAWLGAISYGIYLWHWVLIRLDIRLGLFDSGGDSFALARNAVLVLAETIALASLTYVAIERPFMRRGRRIASLPPR